MNKGINPVKKALNIQHLTNSQTSQVNKGIKGVLRYINTVMGWSKFMPTYPDCRLDNSWLETKIKNLGQSYKILYDFNSNKLYKLKIWHLSIDFIAFYPQHELTDFPLIPLQIPEKVRDRFIPVVFHIHHPFW